MPLGLECVKGEQKVHIAPNERAEVFEPRDWI